MTAGLTVQQFVEHREKLRWMLRCECGLGPRPMRIAEPLDASSGFRYLDEQPRVIGTDSRIVGGGWLACFGYDPKTTALAFYDSLLRWQPDTGWHFESLGLTGREAGNEAAKEHWKDALSAALSGPSEAPRVGPFTVLTDASHEQDRYLAALEQVLSRIDHGRFYQLNLCIRLRARVESPAPVVFGRLSDQLRPAFGALITGPTTQTIATLDTSTLTTSTTVTTTPTGNIRSWPVGKEGYTVVLASVETSKGRAAAEKQANQAIANGLTNVGILNSSDFISLNPGYYVVFMGVYDSAAAAQSGLPAARSRGFPLAYVREVSP